PMCAEPRRRIAFVRIGAEARIGLEPATGPLPDLAASRQARAARRLPLGLAGKPGATPADVSVGFVPGNAAEGPIGLNVRPAQRRADPVRAAPAPAFRAPPPFGPVPAGLHEFAVLA